MSIYQIILFTYLSLLILTQTELQPNDDLKQYQERVQRNSINLNFKHIQTYPFELQPNIVSQFEISVAADQTIKGRIDVYWAQQNVYTDSYYKIGQQVSINIWQHKRKMILSNKFYHAYGFSFDAIKGVRYILRFVTQQRTKMLVLNMDNYLKEGKAQLALNKQHINSHQQKTAEVRDKIKTYLSIVERNTLMNQQIASKINSRLDIYMTYQSIETIFVIVATFVQIYCIKTLLRSQSII